MANKKTPEINASSTADIAFLLLTFFLMSTTMDVDSGLFTQYITGFGKQERFAGRKRGTDAN